MIIQLEIIKFLLNNPIKILIFFPLNLAQIKIKVFSVFYYYYQHAARRPTSSINQSPTPFALFICHPPAPSFPKLISQFPFSLIFRRPPVHKRTTSASTNCTAPSIFKAYTYASVQINMPAILFNTKLIWIFFGSFPRYTPQKSSSLSLCEIFSMPPPHFSGSRG